MVPEDVEETVVLTSYAFESCYPGLEEPVTEGEYERAVAMAERVVRWAESLIDLPARGTQVGASAHEGQKAGVDIGEVGGNQE